MNQELKKLKDIRSESCITIILNTHRTYPENKQDSTLLKNLIAEAEARLLDDEEKRDAWKLVDSLKNLEGKIDHKHNLESLLLFVNEDLEQYIRLPIPVEDRVIIDYTFATRDIIRALHTETDYFILLIDQKRARLVEAFNNRVVEEVKDGFPIERIEMFNTKKSNLSNSKRQGNLQKEFLNRIDKALNEVLKKNTLPVLIGAQESTYSHYLSVADNKSALFDTYFSPKDINADLRIITEESWARLESYTKEQRALRIAELKSSKSSDKFLSDFKLIWKALNEGRIRTLFIEQGLFQPALIGENGKVEFVSDDERDLKIVTDDIYDEMIEMNLAYGGDVVFMPKGQLSDYSGLAAIIRY